MGPKPFTSSSGEISFDKVFSVPQVPGGDSMDSDQAVEDTLVDPTYDEEKKFLREKDIDIQGKF